MIPLAIIAALSKLAPGVIRAAGSLIGGQGGKAAEVIADTLDGGGDLASVAESLPAEQQVELARLANEAQALQNQAHARELEHEETLQGAVQKTAQAEQEFGSSISKRVRPETARDSFRYGMLYVVLFEMLQAFETGTGAEWQLALLIFSPCLAYFGVRTFDKWKGQIGTTV